MSHQDMKDHYKIPNMKLKSAWNYCIRQEHAGANELLDLLQAVSSMRYTASGEERRRLEHIENRLQKIREAMVSSSMEKWDAGKKDENRTDPDDLGQSRTEPEKKEIRPVHGDMSGEPWSLRELEILTKHYDKGKGIETCCQLLPQRTRGGIIEAARKSGLATSKTRYSQSELEAIRNGDFNAVPGRTLTALKVMRSRLLGGKK